MGVGCWERLVLAALVLGSPAGALTLESPGSQPTARTRQVPVLVDPAPEAPEAPSFLRPAAAEEVSAHVRAWFDVVESELVASGHFDYSSRPACDDAPGAYISVVVHITESRYEVHCGEFLRPRGPQLKEILDVIVPDLPSEMDVYVPFGLHDTVVYDKKFRNLGIPVLGSMYHPLYSKIAVPFAMGNIRNTLQPFQNTPVAGWDRFTEEMLRCNSTGARINKAVFRGTTRWKGVKYGTCTQSCGWEDNGRWLLHMLGESHPDKFDTYVTKVEKKSRVRVDYLPLTEQLCNYQAILTVGSNSDWAERLRQCFYGNAVVMLPENSPSEFFSSFMHPWKEFWPIKSDLSDVVDQVSKVISLTNTSRQLRAQRSFAAVYLTEEFMYYYNKLAIMEYAARVKSFVNMKQASAQSRGQSSSSVAVEQARSLLRLGGCQRQPGMPIIQKRPGGCPGNPSSPN